VTRLLVDPNGAPLGSVGLLGFHVSSVTRSKHIETVSVIGSDDDQSLVQLSNLFQMGDGLSNGIVELQKFTEGSVVVHGVEHLVDGSGFRHEQESLVTGSLVEDVDGFQSHLGETRLVDGGTVASGTLGDVGKVLGEDFTVDPLQK
jgi:hypothetical protein